VPKAKLLIGTKS